MRAQEGAATTKVMVSVRHDEGAHRWYVHASGLPGLHAEASTLDELVALNEDVAASLAGNLPGGDDRGAEIPVYVQHRVLTKREHATS